MVRNHKPPSQTWRTFLENHVKTMVSVDFFTVPKIRLQVLYVFLVLDHDRRRILHFAVTAHPTAEWTAQQLREAFPWDTVPRYLLRDRDRIFGKEVFDQIKSTGINQVLSAPRSPWQRAYVERVIGTIRREYLDHVIVFGERSLSGHLQGFVDYYYQNRTHLGLEKDSPEHRHRDLVVGTRHAHGARRGGRTRENHLPPVHFFILLIKASKCDFDSAATVSPSGCTAPTGRGGTYSHPAI
ncbi:MAG: transposase family protein [Acidobacteria bacterium]|nr:transposase family protein [Acidobacteriota bacterium]